MSAVAARLVAVSLLARYRFGGMKGDMDMLLKATVVWTRRIEEVGTGASSCSLPRSTRDEKEEEEEEDKKTEKERQARSYCTQLLERRGERGGIAKDDVCLEGIDFHCSRVLDDVMQQRRVMSGEDAMERWKEASWICDCGVNVRLRYIDGAPLQEETKDPAVERTWASIREDVRLWRSTYADKRCD